jgi:hypothetical protein
MPDNTDINLDKSEITQDFVEYEIYDHYITEVNELKYTPDEAVVNTARVLQTSVEFVKEIIEKYETK